MDAVQGQPEVETHRQIISLSQDSFYRELDEEDLKLAKKGHFNFDHPGTLSIKRLSRLILLTTVGPHFKYFSTLQRHLDQRKQENTCRVIFRSSDAFDHDLMLACLKDIREGKKTNVPVYDFITNARYVFKVYVLRDNKEAF